VCWGLQLLERGALSKQCQTVPERHSPLADVLPANSPWGTDPVQGDDKGYHAATERVIEIMSGDFEGVEGSGVASTDNQLRQASQGARVCMYARSLVQGGGGSCGIPTPHPLHGGLAGLSKTTAGKMMMGISTNSVSPPRGLQEEENDEDHIKVGEHRSRNDRHPGGLFHKFLFF